MLVLAVADVLSGVFPSAHVAAAQLFGLLMVSAGVHAFVVVLFVTEFSYMGNYGGGGV